MTMHQTRTAPRAEMLFERIVVPVEGTDREFVSQRWAAEFAAATGVPVTAVHVDAALDDGPGDRFTYLERLCERWNVDLETLDIAGTDVAATLLDELDPLDLVVVGTRRLGGDYHVGSVTETLIRGAPCPVQVLRIE